MRDVDAIHGLLPDLLAVPGGPCASQDGLFSIPCVICGERLLSQWVGTTALPWVAKFKAAELQFGKGGRGLHLARGGLSFGKGLTFGSTGTGGPAPPGKAALQRRVPPLPLSLVSVAAPTPTRP